VIRAVSIRTIQHVSHGYKGQISSVSVVAAPRAIAMPSSKFGCRLILGGMLKSHHSFWCRHNSGVIDGGPARWVLHPSSANKRLDLAPLRRATNGCGGWELATPSTQSRRGCATS
jgi:hypothetical protein